MDFKSYLEKNNISKKQAAEELGFNEMDIHRYSNKLVIPRPEKLIKIVKWSNGEIQPNDFYEVAE